MSQSEEYERYLEKQAESLGLPTDPEAYQDGGDLSVLLTVASLDEANLIASSLRAVGIPAWVEGAHMAGLYWHAQCGLFPKGIRVLVPMAHLADAESVVATRHEDPDAILEDDLPDPDVPRQLLKRARWITLGMVLFMCAGPIWAILAYGLSVQVRREEKHSGPSPELRKARRWALAVVLIVGAVYLLFLGSMGANLVIGR